MTDFQMGPIMTPNPIKAEEEGRRVTDMKQAQGKVRETQDKRRIQFTFAVLKLEERGLEARNAFRT